MSDLIQKAIDQTERAKYGVSCAEAVHALDIANQYIAQLEEWKRAAQNTKPVYTLEESVDWHERAEAAEAALERVRWVLDEIVSAYRAYRACGVIPAPDPYQRLVEAIKCADELAAALKEGE